MNYYKSIVDRNGYVHSCDNVVVEYLVKNFNTDSIVEEFHKIKELINPEVYWEKLHVSSCSKFSFYENIIHINSIHILFGKYREYDRLLRKWIILPMIRIEVNPNKHFDTPEFKAIIEFTKSWCCSMNIRKIDYAIDLPYTIDKVCIYNSRKEPGLYKGTVYRGARGKNGFCRIYNKAKEQKLDYPLTRVEHTMEIDKPRSLEHIFIMEPSKGLNYDKLDSVNQCIVKLCLLLQKSGIEYTACIEKLNYRRKKKIESYLIGEAIELEYPEDIYNELLETIKKLFDPEYEDNIVEDDNKWQELTNDDDLPF